MTEKILFKSWEFINTEQQVWFKEEKSCVTTHSKKWKDKYSLVKQIITARKDDSFVVGIISSATFENKTELRVKHAMKF